RRIEGPGFAPGLRWSSDGTQLAVCRRDKFAWYDAASGRLVREIALPRHEGYVRKARLVAGGRQVVATIVDKSAQGAPTSLLAAGAGRERLRFRARALDLFVDLSEDGRHTLLSAISKSQEPLLRVRQPDGRLIWQGGTGDLFPEARLFA